ncbi:uncharacterized protein HMPREF1541_06853 [Cyphellophora europaea CBS 101466]|uniref:gamma-glutamylcyclotransferase n=1 Tax=Cyphellophora europaea (strain CBS 101466) TaxID=1220924 RepID=W2RSW3_CYPE1|nr:uncharacterized protein HMPREF1541_06853 [Cyphellophora europaea CBS 101466]ETN38814.1 hypothetical protein HMPREF1541_06853 [Cyphellophora europaea CBS 101466]
MPDKHCAIASLQEWASIPANKLKRRSRSIPTSPKTTPRTSQTRQRASLHETSLDTTDLCHDVAKGCTNKDKTVLYLAYGSNLCDETFLGKRQIKPLSQINVLVPEIVMTFDLPGIAYQEPCFANVRYRMPEEKVSIDHGGYHKDRWQKGLVGVVYEVTLEDYAHIIATEGGGAGYQDVLVDCHPLDANPRNRVPEQPSSSPFKAHTLFDPAGQHRPDPSYAQPSARYLKLITDGAMERGLPYEYQDYLHQIRVYHTTTAKQKFGQLLYMAFWGPLFTLLMRVAGPMFAKPDGTFPSWLGRLFRVLFTAAWASYDNFFKPMFGDGERTIGDTKDNQVDAVDDEKAPLIRETVRRYGIHGRLETV